MQHAHGAPRRFTIFVVAFALALGITGIAFA